MENRDVIMSHLRVIEAMSNEITLVMRQSRNGESLPLYHEVLNSLVKVQLELSELVIAIDESRQ